MMLGARMAAWIGKRIPYDAEVEWIQGDNSSWIDLGISPHDVNNIRVKFETANESHSNNRSEIPTHI